MTGPGVPPAPHNHHHVLPRQHWQTGQRSGLYRSPIPGCREEAETPQSTGPLPLSLARRSRSINLSSRCFRNSVSARCSAAGAGLVQLCIVLNVPGTAAIPSCGPVPGYA